MRRPISMFVLFMMLLSFPIYFGGDEISVEGDLLDGSGLVTRDPILIEGDSNFTGANGVSSGNGSLDDPFIIENWSIFAEDEVGIIIKDTSFFFTIRNCLVKDGMDISARRSFSGIYLESVENGSVKNCRLARNHDGVMVVGSSNLLIDNNTCTGNSQGIFLREEGRNIIIRNNTCNYNYDGITIKGDFQYGRVSNNTCMRNTKTGLSLEDDCRDFIVENNVCNFNFDVKTQNDESGRGILIVLETRIILRSNNCSGNSGFGIEIWGGGYGKLIDNTAIDNIGLGRNTTGYGIFLRESIGYVLKDNKVANCMLKISGNELEHWLTISADGSNLVNGKPFLFIKNRTAPAVWSGDHENLLMVNSNGQTIEDMDLVRSSIQLAYSGNITIDDVSVNMGGEGIYLYGCNNVSIANARITGGFYGIQVVRSRDILVHNNSISGYRRTGISFSSSPYSTIEDNYLKSSGGSGILFSTSTYKSNIGLETLEGHSTVRRNTVYGGETGITCSSHGIRIEDNIMISQGVKGIGIGHSHFTSISGNTILGCDNGIQVEVQNNNNTICGNFLIGNRVGVKLFFECSGNLVTGNVIKDSEEYGLSIEREPEAGALNIVYDNSFINNNGGGVQAFDDSTNSTWDGGNGTGNYWDDYASRYVPPAVKNGSYWSVPYMVDGGAGSVDRFPLVNNSVKLEEILLIIGDLVDKAPVGEQYESQFSIAYTGNRSGNISWSFSTDAEWLNFTQDHVLKGKPKLSDQGNYWVRINVSDGVLTDSLVFTIDVVLINLPPNITTADVKTIDQWQHYRVDYDATDDGNHLEWRLVTEASFLSINRTTGVLSGTPGLNDVGTFFVNVSVNDGELWDKTHFYLTVNDVNDPPMMNSSYADIFMMEDNIFIHPIKDIFFNYDEDPLDIFVTGVENISVMINDSGLLFITPEADWHGLGNLIFHVSDGVYNISFEMTVYVQNVNDPPRGLVIHTSGSTFLEGGNQTVYATFFDPDLNDTANLTWIVEGIGTLGYGISINLSLPEGTYNLTLRVRDSSNGSSEISMIIVIEKETVPYDPDGERTTPWLLIGLVSLLILGIIAFVIIILRKRSTMTVEPHEDILASPPTLTRRGMGIPGSGPEPISELELEGMMRIETDDISVGSSVGVPWIDDLDDRIKEPIEEAFNYQDTRNVDQDMELIRTGLKRKVEDGSLTGREYARLRSFIDRTIEE